MLAYERRSIWAGGNWLSLSLALLSLLKRGVEFLLDGVTIQDKLVRGKVRRRKRRHIMRKQGYPHFQ